MMLFAVCRTRHGDDWELNGIFSTEKAAAEICDSASVVVRFELNKDYRDIHEFEITVPVVENAAA